MMIQNKRISIKRIGEAIRGSLSSFASIMIGPEENKAEATDPEPTPPADPPAPPWVQEWADFMELVPVGAKIEYLGIRMMAVAVYPAGLSDIIPGCIGAARRRKWVEGEIYCEYVDKVGVIQSKSFSSRLAVQGFGAAVRAKSEKEGNA